MAKRMKNVAARKGEDMTIRVSQEVLDKAKAAALRKVYQKSVLNRSPGSCALGESETQRTRRDRRKSRQELREIRHSGGRGYD